MLPCLPIPICTTKIFAPSAMDTEPCLLAYILSNFISRTKKIQIKNKTRNCNEDIIPICNNNNNNKKMVRSRETPPVLPYSFTFK